MKRKLTLVFVAALSALSVLASAQYTREPMDPTPHNFSFRLGIVFPFESELREVSDRFFGVGADYRFGRQFIKNSETFFSIDYIARATNGDQGHFFPICINQRFWDMKEVAGRRAYFFVGIGAFVYDIVKTDTVFGARGGFGLELGPAIFAEAVFFMSEDTDTGINGSSAGLFLGYRF